MGWTNPQYRAGASQYEEYPAKRLRREFQSSIKKAQGWKEGN